MPGAGYDIGASAASSWSIPLTANSSTTINYGTGTFTLPTTQDITSEPVSVATTKSPGSQTSVGGTGSGQTNGTNPTTGYAQDLGILGVSGGSGNTLLYVALAVLATLVILKR